jgi:hypothetical protein
VALPGDFGVIRSGKYAERSAERLRSWIVLDGKPGDFLPTEPEMLARFGVSARPCGKPSEVWRWRA